MAELNIINPLTGTPNTATTLAINPSTTTIPSSVMQYSGFEPVSSANNKIIFEFPNAVSGGKFTTAYIVMNSIITLTYSVYRAKMPVIPLGSDAVTGFALGTRTVAGTIIKILNYNDDLASFMKIYVDQATNARGTVVPNLGDKMQISQKDFYSIMRDDLTPFNIHSYTISEYTGEISCDSIYGCTIINNGQVQSIENLITENTMSFIAQSVRQAYDPGTVTTSLPTLTSVMTGSKLLKQQKL